MPRRGRTVGTRRLSLSIQLSFSRAVIFAAAGWRVRTTHPPSECSTGHSFSAATPYIRPFMIGICQGQTELSCPHSRRGFGSLIVS